MTIDTATYYRCQDLLYRLWNALDHRKIEEIMSCLTADARWQRERWYEGASAIRMALLARPDDMVIRHAFANLIVDQEDSGFRWCGLLGFPFLAKSDSRLSFGGGLGFDGSIGAERCGVGADGSPNHGMS